jgi:hypothetical protein
MFRARVLGGRDAWFALGAFFAPAPWRGDLSNALNVSGAVLSGACLGGDRYRSEILPGEPPEGVVPVDWAAVEKMAKTPVSAAMTYELAWGSPRLAGKAVKMRFSFKTAPFPAAPPG